MAEPHAGRLSRTLLRYSICLLRPRIISQSSSLFHVFFAFIFRFWFCFWFCLVLIAVEARADLSRCSWEQAIMRYWILLPLFKACLHSAEEISPFSCWFVFCASNWSEVISFIRKHSSFNPADLRRTIVNASMPAKIKKLCRMTLFIILLNNCLRLLNELANDLRLYFECIW